MNPEDSEKSLILIDHEFLDWIQVRGNERCECLVVIRDLLTSALWPHRAGWPHQAGIGSAVTLRQTHTHTHTRAECYWLLLETGGVSFVLTDSLRSSLCRSCLCSWSWSWWSQTRRCRLALLRRPAHEPSSCTWPDSRSPAPPGHRQIHAVWLTAGQFHNYTSKLRWTFCLCLFIHFHIRIQGYVYYCNEHRLRSWYENEWINTNRMFIWALKCYSSATNNE